MDSRDEIKAGKGPSRVSVETEPTDVLREFIALFISKGWLNRTL